MSLDEFGQRHGTDKSSRIHGYLPIYEQFLHPLRDKEIKILEIGIKDGASLKLWEDYFPKAYIVGVDIIEKTRAFGTHRVSIEIGNQEDPRFIAKLIERHGPFDIIIEDGSHWWPHQIFAIKHLVPALRPSGLFISEDLQVSFPPLAEQYSRGAARSAYDFLQELAQRVLRYKDGHQAPADDAELDRLVPLLSWVLFLRHACILRRHD